MPTQGDAPGSGVKDSRKPRTEQTVLPVTIKQLMEAQNQDETWKIDGQELSHVLLVGAVTAVTPAQLMIKYTIEDGTGKCDVTWWMDDDGDQASAKRSSQIREGMYVRVVGKTRLYNDQFQVTAFDVNPIKDHNEVTYHFLNCIQTHLRNTIAPKEQQGNNNASLNPGFAYGARPNVAVEQKPMQMDQPGDLDSTQSQVLAIIAQNSHSEEGVSIQTLSSQLGGMGESDIRNAIDFLSSEGHLYSTIDEDHFKATSVDTY